MKREVKSILARTNNRIYVFLYGTDSKNRDTEKYLEINTKLLKSHIFVFNKYNTDVKNAFVNSLYRFINDPDNVNGDSILWILPTILSDKESVISLYDPVSDKMIAINSKEIIEYYYI